MPILEKQLTGVRSVFISYNDIWTGMCSCLNEFYTFFEKNVGLVFGGTHLTMNGHKGSISVGIRIIIFTRGAKHMTIYSKLVNPGVQCCEKFH